MDISYLLSILDLYLLREKNSKIVVQVDNLENIVRVDFSYSSNLYNTTFVKISKESFFENLKFILSKIETSLEVKKEDKNNQNKYTLLFSNERKIIFINFSIGDIKIIKSHLNIDDDNIFIFEDNYDEKLESIKVNKLQLANHGFSSYLTILLTSIWFLDVLVISLWIFKAFIR